MHVEGVQDWFLSLKNELLALEQAHKMWLKV